MLRKTLCTITLAASLIAGCGKSEPKPDLVYSSWQLEPYHIKHLDNWIGDFPKLSDEPSYYTLYENLERRSWKSAWKPYDGDGIFNSPIKNIAPTSYEGYLGLWIDLDDGGTRFVRFLPPVTENY
jgi:hypothetical protein